MVTSATKLEAAVEMELIVVRTELMVVYSVPTSPPVVELPKTDGNREVIVAEGDPELRGVLYDILTILPPAFTFFGILAMFDRAVFPALVTAVILAAPGIRLFIVLFIVARLEFRLPNCVSNCFSPTKNELPSVVTFPFKRSSNIIELAHPMLVKA